ncbi:MAG: lysophospholipid acyltransferase family protein [Polyangiaceae bacterium]
MDTKAPALSEEIAQRIERLELPFNEAGFDPYGVSKRTLGSGMKLLGFLYRHYFHVACRGIEHVPPRGRVMLVGNHSGGYAIDAAMVIAACFFELDPPRLAQGMADRFINRIPFLSQWTNRGGQITGLPQHAQQLLMDDRVLLVFPEGARGTAKLFWERYSLRHFGTGFVRLSLRTKTPIVPFAFLGGGEAVPTIANLKLLGKLLGIPYVPVTPYLLPIPLPVKAEIEFGEPLRFEGNGDESDNVMQDRADQVKAAIQLLIESGRARRAAESTSPRQPAASKEEHA